MQKKNLYLFNMGEIFIEENKFANRFPEDDDPIEMLSGVLSDDFLETFALLSVRPKGRAAEGKGILSISTRIWFPQFGQASVSWI